MNPIKFKEVNTLVGANQEEYIPLEGHTCNHGILTVCWYLRFGERLKLLLTGRIWAQFLTCGNPITPHKLEVDKPYMESK